MNSLLHNLVERSLQPTQSLRIVPPVYGREASTAITPQLFTQDEVAFSREFPSSIGTSEQSVAAATPPTSDTLKDPAPLVSRNVRKVSHSEQASPSVQASPIDTVLPLSDVVILPDALSSLKSSMRSGDRPSSLQTDAATGPERYVKSTTKSQVEAESSDNRGQEWHGGSNVEAPHRHQDEGSRSGSDRPALAFDETVRMVEPQRIEGPGDKSHKKQQLAQDQVGQNQATLRPAAGFQAAERVIHPNSTFLVANKQSTNAAAAIANSDSVAPAERHVTISIGRLELKFTGGKPLPERTAHQVPTTSSLDEYLRLRTAGGAR